MVNVRAPNPNTFTIEFAYAGAGQYWQTQLAMMDFTTPFATYFHATGCTEPVILRGNGQNVRPFRTGRPGPRTSSPRQNRTRRCCLVGRTRNVSAHLLRSLSTPPP